MSDDNDNSESFYEFKGSPDPTEGGITMNEMIMGLGFVLIIAGFILGLIRLLGLKDGEIPADYDSHIDQLYLSYIIMFLSLIHI